MNFSLNNPHLPRERKGLKSSINFLHLSESESVKRDFSIRISEMRFDKFTLNPDRIKTYRKLLLNLD